MLKCLWFMTLCTLISSCASSPDGVNQDDSTGEAIGSALPTPVVEKSNFSAYFSTIDSEILLNIQNGSPSSIQSAMSALRNNTTSEQALVLLAICVAIMDYAWPSKMYTSLSVDYIPDNVYISTVGSIARGLYERSTTSEDFLSLTIPSLNLFSTTNDEYYLEAKTDLERSLQLDNDSVLVLYLLGVLEMRMGNNNDSHAYLEKALTLDADNLDIIYAYFENLLELDNVEQAYVFSKEIIQEYPTDTKLLELSAVAAYNTGDYTAAESLIAQTLRFSPDNASLILFRAKILFELADYLDVSSLLDVYARTNSNNKEYLLLRSKLQSTWNKNIPSAIRTIQDALTLYPNDSDILLYAANLASSSAQRILGKSALELIEQVLENDPQNIQALEILAKESIDQQDWQAAYEASNIVMQQEEVSISSMLRHVEICIALNLLQEARNTITPYYSDDTGDESMKQWYLRLLIAEGRYSDARNLIERLLPAATGRMKSILFFERSRLQSNDERILSDLRSSLTSNPRNEYALFGLYEYYYERDDYSKAQYYLKQVIALNPSNADALQRNAELDNLLQ